MKKNNNLYGEKIKNIFINNIGIKLCSFILAIVVWAIIINIDDPYKTRTFSVDVETVNESALQSVNKVYEIIEGNTASVKVKGKKSIVDKLDSTDIRATADLSNLSAVNAVPIVPSLRKMTSSEITLECTQVLKVSLENRASKQVKVNVITQGTPEEGFTIGECSAKPNMIEVSGGESSVELIDSVRVLLDVSGASENFSKRLKPEAYDKDGKRVESSTLSFSSAEVRVFANILENKLVPVKIKIVGEPADGYQYISTDCLPEEVEIAGNNKKLSGIDQIIVPIDITGMTNISSGLEQDIHVSDYLPEGVTATDDSTISVKINIEQLVKKNIQIDVSSIRFLSVGEGLKAEIIDDMTVVNVLVTGRASVLNGIDGREKGYLNCNKLEEGIYTLNVMLQDIDESCTILEGAKLRVKISKLEDDNNNPVVSPKPTGEPEPADTAEPDEPAAPTEIPDNNDKDSDNKEDENKDASSSDETE